MTGDVLEYSHNMILTSPGKVYVPDADGNVDEINDGAGPPANVLADLSWDKHNRMERFSIPGGKVTDYDYDPFGRRVTREVTNSGTQRILKCDGITLY